MTRVEPRSRTVLRRWPLWLGGVLVASATVILLALFYFSIQQSQRAATDRVLAQQTIERLRTAQAGMHNTGEMLAGAILRHDPQTLPRAAMQARQAMQVFEGEGGNLRVGAGEWMRRFYSVYAAAGSSDWSVADDALTRLIADQPLTREVTHRIAQENSRWASADEGMMASDARTRGFAVPVAGAGLLLILAASLLGFLAAQATRLYGRARRRAEQDAERASALEAAVGARTAELVEANAHLEREMTERGAAEAQLRQAQKMDAIGQLTGGIAHDFNNMLSVVVGGIELAKRRAGEPAQVARHLDRAMEGCERAVALTRRLLSFARAEPVNAQHLSLNDVVRGVGDMLERTLGEQITISLDLADDLWPVLVDRGPLENAILNLAVNARDAMPGGGALRIASRNDVQSETAELTVADNGIGMPADVRDRALEPFFTTKASGVGTGLGLSQIFGLVKAADGRMEIDSTPGLGTTVRIALPAFPDAAVDGEPTGVVAAPDVEVRSSDVLVVEDDARVRRATVHALEALGHRVRACSDGAAALALLRGGGTAGLVVSDVVMPGLSGPDMARELERLEQDIPILFVTGYADTERADVLARYELLRKPFTLDQLASAIGRALERVSGSHPTAAATGAAKPRPAEAAGAAMP